MTDDRFWPPEPAPVRDPNPEITIITGLEGALPRPVWRAPTPLPEDNGTPPGRDEES
ncbi:hypothetical protein [Streptomyces sp. NPDC049881]|uniref:hypothetical protein n=1 Tax=Streptomyces sp. NPDC049881 TaxID=3155778 RepID=UPI00344973E8